MTSLKLNLLQELSGLEKNKAHPIGEQTDYAVEVMKIKFNVKLVFKIQKQSFADVFQNRRS